MEPLNFMPPFSCISICSGLRAQGLGTQATLHASSVPLTQPACLGTETSHWSWELPSLSPLSKKILWLLEVTQGWQKGDGPMAPSGGQQQMVHTLTQSA